MNLNLKFCRMHDIDYSLLTTGLLFLLIGLVALATKSKADEQYKNTVSGASRKYGTLGVLIGGVSLIIMSFLKS